jgi:hypothetical protein
LDPHEKEKLYETLSETTKQKAIKNIFGTVGDF